MFVALDVVNAVIGEGVIMPDRQYWPLKRCLPCRMEDGYLFCKTHNTSKAMPNTYYDLEVLKACPGWSLPSSDILCNKAQEIQIIAYQAIENYKQFEKKQISAWRV